MRVTYAPAKTHYTPTIRALTLTHPVGHFRPIQVAEVDEAVHANFPALLSFEPKDPMLLSAYFPILNSFAPYLEHNPTYLTTYVQKVCVGVCVCVCLYVWLCMCVLQEPHLRRRGVSVCVRRCLHVCA